MKLNILGRVINEHLEVIGTTTNPDKPLLVKCLDCGRLKSINYKQVRQVRTKCSYCNTFQSQERKELYDKIAEDIKVLSKEEVMSKYDISKTLYYKILNMYSVLPPNTPADFVHCKCNINKDK